MTILEEFNEIKKNNIENNSVIKPILEKSSNSIYLVICSIFSVIFGLSIITIITDNQEINITVIGIFIFLLFILILNEKVKVNYLKEFGKNRLTKDLVISIISICISLISLFGIYTNVNNYNKSMENINKKLVEIDSTTDKTILKIEQSKSFISDSINKFNESYVKTINDINKILAYKLTEEDKQIRNNAYNKLQESKEAAAKKIDYKISEIKRLSEIKKEKILVSSTNSTTKTLYVAIIFMVLSFIIECVIIVLSYIEGKALKEYENKLDIYNIKKKEQETKRRQFLEENEDFKLFKKCISIIKRLFLLSENNITKQLILDLSISTKKESESIYVLFKKLEILSSDNDSNSIFIKKENEILIIIDNYFTNLIND